MSEVMTGTMRANSFCRDYAVIDGVSGDHDIFNYFSMFFFCSVLCRYARAWAASRFIIQIKFE